MTLTQFIEFCRNRHNAASDTNWSDSEIRALITARANEVLAYIGLIEAVTTTTSTASTQTYAFPTNAMEIKQVNYKNYRLKRISFEEWEFYKNESGTITGRPRAFLVWDNLIYLVPTPDTSAETIQIFYLKEHVDIDGTSQTTIDIPSVLHPHLAIGVIADMFAKDLNGQMTTMYESKWMNQSVPAFLKYKRNYRSAGQLNTLGDSDSEENVGRGAF